jgi:hypothetical protein
MRIIIALLLLTTMTFAQGAEPGPAMWMAPRGKFLFAWYDQDPAAAVIYNTLQSDRSHAYLTHPRFRRQLKQGWAVERSTPQTGYDNLLQARTDRIQASLLAPMVRVHVRPLDGWQDTVLIKRQFAGWRHWIEMTGFGLAPGDHFIDAWGSPWRMHAMLLDEFILVGRAVTRWRCEPRNRPIIEVQLHTEIEDMDEFCQRTNADAHEVLSRFRARSLGK